MENSVEPQHQTTFGAAKEAVEIKFIKTSQEESLELIEKAIKEIPSLTAFGIGIFSPVRQAKELGITVREYEAREIPNGQAELRSEYGRMCTAASADYIKNLTPLKGVNKKRGSYGMKHKVEAWTKARGRSIYTFNGAFIAAAVGLGFKYKDHGPNASFNFSEASIRNMYRETREYEDGRMDEGHFKWREHICREITES